MKKKKKTEDELVKYVDERKQEATNWTVLRQIQINRNFYKGNQWISWDNVKKTTYEPERKPGEKRYTYNKIKPHVLTLLAKLSKSRVQLEVYPDTNDDERIEVAKAGYKFLKSQWQEDKMDGKSRRLKHLMLIDGMPAIKVFADKSKGQDIPEVQDAELAKLVGDIPKKTGKITTLVIDQSRYFVDPTAESIDEIGWVVEEFPKDVDEIENEYGIKVEKEEIQIRQSFELSFGNDAKKRYSNHAMVREFWHLPCGEYPNGVKITVAGGKKLDYNEDPGEWPYIFFPMIPVPGTAIADGVVKDLTTPQMSYNVKRTAEARMLEEMGIGKWAVPENSMSDESEISDEISGIYHYVPINGMKPQREPGIEPGAGWQNAMERDESDMEDISGAHEISQGAVPKGIDTYGGLQLLVEQDETKLAVAAHSYEEGIKLWGEKVLRLVKKHFPEEQQLKIVGENGQIDAFTFAGADLSGNEMVDVIPNSSMPEVRAVKEQKIFQMWGAGMFVDPKTGRPDTRRVVRMLGQSIATSYFDDSELHENKAKMEQRQWESVMGDPEMANKLMMYSQELQRYQGLHQQSQAANIDPAQYGLEPPQPPVKLPSVRDFYDHQEHLDNHNRFRLSDFYDNLPPELQYLIDEHCKEHEQALTAPQIAQQQEQMQMQQAQADQQAQMQQQQMQVEAMKAQAEQGRAQAQMQHQASMKAMDHQHDMNKAALQGTIALQQAALRQSTGQR